MAGYWALRRLLLAPESGDGGGGNGNGEGGNSGGEGEGNNAGSGGDDGDDDLKDADAEKVREALKRERTLRKEKEREARTLRTEKEERDKKDRLTAEDEAKKKGEWEQLAKTAQTERDAERVKREALEATIVEDRKANAVRFAASQLRFHDPEEAVRLLDLSAITVDDDGQPQEVAKAVKTLADAKKYLINSGAKGEGMPNTPGRQGEEKAYSASRSYINKMYTPKKSA